MAGSYRHILGGWSMIENMGDAYEAVEELMWLIQSELGTDRALALLQEKYYPMCRGEIEKDAALISVQKMMEE